MNNSHGDDNVNNVTTSVWSEKEGPMGHSAHGENDNVTPPYSGALEGTNEQVARVGGCGEAIDEEGLLVDGD